MSYAGDFPAKKNAEFLLVFPIMDADGDLVVAAGGLDSEVSKDKGDFVDCTNEASEIGSSGMYWITLTATEMNANVVAVITKTSTSGAKTTPTVIYTSTEQLKDLIPAGSGATEKTYTVYAEDGITPLADVDVWVTTNENGSNVIASGKTDQNGEVTFYLDSGDVYIFRQKTGWNFSPQPDLETVP